MIGYADAVDSWPFCLKLPGMILASCPSDASVKRRDCTIVMLMYSSSPLVLRAYLVKGSSQIQGWGMGLAFVRPPKVRKCPGMGGFNLSQRMNGRSTSIKKGGNIPPPIRPMNHVVVYNRLLATLKVCDPAGDQLSKNSQFSATSGIEKYPIQLSNK